MSSLGGLDGKTFHAVIFDLDGDVWWTRPRPFLRCWRTWMFEFGVDPEVARREDGVPAADLVRQLLPDAASHQAGIERIQALEVADVEGIVTLPGAAEALASLPTGQVAIATSCSARLATARMGGGCTQPSLSDRDRGTMSSTASQRRMPSCWHPINLASTLPGASWSRTHPRVSQEHGLPAAPRSQSSRQPCVPGLRPTR